MLQIEHPRLVVRNGLAYSLARSILIEDTIFVVYIVLQTCEDFSKPQVCRTSKIPSTHLLHENSATSCESPTGETSYHLDGSPLQIELLFHDGALTVFQLLPALNLQ